MVTRKKATVPIVADSKKYLAEVSLTDCLSASREFAVDCLRDHDFQDDMGSAQTFISNVIIRPLDYFVAKRFQDVNVEDVRFAFDTFTDIILELNQKILFIPLKQTFCRYINISTSTFDHKLNEQNEMGDLFRMINDRLTGDYMQNLIMGRIGANQGIFGAKAIFGLRDNDPPVTNIVQVNAETRGLADILAEYKKNGY